MDVGLAVVTGGGGGLGRLITRQFAERGFRVVIADLNHAAALDLVSELESDGHRAVALQTDLAEAASVERLMVRVSELGKLRVLVNNAGGWLPGPQYPASAEWRRGLSLNLLTPMLTAQLALPLMRGTGGGIVNISSSGGLGNQPYGSPEYGAAKAGLIRYTSCVGDWIDKHQVRVNCVVPHSIGLDRARREYEQLTDQEKRASGGLVDPELVASTVTHLAVDDRSSGRIVIIRADREPYDLDSLVGSLQRVEFEQLLSD